MLLLGLTCGMRKIMNYCPFFNRICPQSSECAIWTAFGCCMIDKPGIPAIYTDGEENPVDCYILQMFSEKAAINDGVMIVYALESDGSIHLEDDITKFVVHQLH